MNVLVTRPREDAERLKVRLEESGCAALLAPLIEIELLPVADLAGAAALIATSRNGLRAVANSAVSETAKALPVFVVGSSTAALARKAGFLHVIEGGATAAELAQSLPGSAFRPAGPVAHLAGDVSAFDLASALATGGIEVRTLQTYRSVAVAHLPPEVLQALETGAVDAVILMSPRTARIWLRLVSAALEPAQIDRIVHICLSNAVAGALDNAVCAEKILISKEPNLEETLLVVKRLAAEAGQE